MTAHTTIQATLLPMQSSDMQEGYEKGRIWYFYGERQGEPDEEYLITNLRALFADGAFKQQDLLRWHVGFLLGMISGALFPEEDDAAHP